MKKKKRISILLISIVLVFLSCQVHSFFTNFFKKFFAYLFYEDTEKKNLSLVDSQKKIDVVKERIAKKVFHSIFKPRLSSLDEKLEIFKTFFPTFTNGKDNVESVFLLLFYTLSSEIFESLRKKRNKCN